MEKLVLKHCVSFIFCLSLHSSMASAMKAIPVKRDVADKTALQNTTEASRTSINADLEYGIEPTEIAVQYALFAAALLVGVIVGVAVILICIYCLKIRDHRKMSKNQAGTIEKRHDVYKDRSSEDSKGYTSPLSPQKLRPYAARDQIKEDDEGYLVPSRESGRLLIDLHDELESLYITPNEPRKQEAIVPNGRVSPCQSSQAPGTNFTSDHMPIYEHVERLDDGYAQAFIRPKSPDNVYVDFELSVENNEYCEIQEKSQIP